jgi:uroporphyrinogen decarboxylase
MNNRERVLAALNHREPDKIPFDIGGAPNTGIHIIAYSNLLKHWRDYREVELGDFIFQTALIDEDILQRLKVDLRGLDFSVFGSPKIQSELKEDNKYFYFTGDWGIKWVMPKINGLYYDVRQRPLSGRIEPEEIDTLNIPNLPSREEIDFFKRKAKIYREKGFAVVLAGPDGGILEHAFGIRGHEDFMIDMVSEQGLAKKLLDKILIYKLQYWELMLKEMGNLVDIVSEGDDMATQESLLISPKLYRSMLKPLHRELFCCMRKNAEKPIFINFHSCGAIKELIPDLIEIGINSLHPVQVSAAGIDTKKLKKEFGQDLTFWGGGVDTQHILSRGTTEEVRDEVRRRIDDLAPGGGFIFAAVHNIQADVPPENIMAMWEAFNEYSKYK